MIFVFSLFWLWCLLNCDVYLLFITSILISLFSECWIFNLPNMWTNYKGIVAKWSNWCLCYLTSWKNVVQCTYIFFIIYNYIYKLITSSFYISINNNTIIWRMYIFKYTLSWQSLYFIFWYCYFWFSRFELTFLSSLKGKKSLLFFFFTFFSSEKNFFNFFEKP